MPRKSIKKTSYYKRTSGSSSARSRAVSSRRSTGGHPYWPRSTEVKSVDYAIASGASILCEQISLLALTEPGAAAHHGLSYLNQRIRFGPGYDQRIGMKINLRSIHIKGELHNTGAANTAGPVRVMLLYDRVPSAALAPTDIVLDNDPVAAQFNGGINLTKQKRFKVLTDRYYTLDTVSRPCQRVNIYKKFNLAAEYSASTGFVGDIAVGGLILLIAFYPSTVGFTANYTNFHYRMRYTDN